MSNCYLLLFFRREVISCTPSQEFYRASTKELIQAYKLRKGDRLLCSNVNNDATIVDIKLIHGANTVFTFDLECDFHTFLVGQLGIVAHNTALPIAFEAGFMMAFGEGAAVGGEVGSAFGPVTIVGGFLLGGVIGVGIYALANSRRPTYALGFSTKDIEKDLNINFNKMSGQQNNGGGGNNNNGNGGDGQDPNDPKKPNDSDGNRPEKPNNGPELNKQINPKIYKKLGEELLQYGENAIKRGYRSALKTLAEHKEKLENLQYKSQVETTIKNVQQQINTLEKFMQDNGIDFHGN